MGFKTISVLLANAAAVLCLAVPAPAQQLQSGWLVDAEYLNWRTTRSSTAFSGILTFGANGSFVNDLLETEFDRDSGGRLTLGRRYANRSDVMFRFTYFDNDGSQQVGDATVDTDSVFANLIDRSLADNRLNRNFDDGHVDFAQEDIELRYSVYDLEFGKTFGRSTLSARPFGGIRFADIGQSVDVRYENFTAPAELDTYDLNSDVDMTAWGIRAGGQVNYGLFGSGLSVFGRGAGSLMLADFRVHRLDVATDQPAAIAESREYQHSYNTVIPQLELAVGLRYDRGRFFVATGYDIAYWFNMYQHIDISGHDDVDGNTSPIRADRGALGFDGFFVQTGVVF